MPSGVPSSRFMFIAAAVIAGLQLFPIPGVMMMLVGGPFLTGLFVTAGFAVMTFEALTRRISIGWLVFPGVYVLGYAGAVFYSHHAFDVLARSVEAKNQAARLTIDLRATPIVFENIPDEIYRPAEALATWTTLPIVYEFDARNFARPLQGYQRDESRCRLVQQDRAARKVPAWLARIRPGDCTESVSAEPLVGGLSVEPPKGGLIVTATHSKVDDPFLSYQKDGIRLAAPNGRSVELAAGYAKPLFWLPFPIIGCSLNSGGPRWECFATFVRERPKPFGGDPRFGSPAVGAVAGALGLAYSPP